jgi:SpoVK/Ycf46/Vps4 family AAA+-type ATPase
MSEKQDLIYLYCTANDISKIPGEFLRAGRFDTIFWSDLPSKIEYKEIIDIHCKLNNINVSDEELNNLTNIAVTREMTGAEIEQTIISANFKIASSYQKMGLNIFNESYVIANSMKSIKTYVSKHKNYLTDCRKIALENYQFTSNDIKETLSKEFDV